MIGVGKDAYNSSLDGMIDQNILPWVEDREEEGYPVWDDYEAVQRSTYFLDRQGELIYQFNITTLDPESPEDYSYIINLILDFRSNNGPGILRVIDDYLSIQSAIDNAMNGDIILVDPGVYNEQINFLDKNISLVALPYSGYEDNAYGSVVLDGGGQGSVVTINNGQDQSSILLGFKIQNGFSQNYGGGILIEDSSPTIDRNIIHNNIAGSCGGGGGGIAIVGTSYPHIFGNEIFDNTVQGDCDCICYFGGGIYVDSSSWPILGGSVTIGNIFYDNYADRGESLYKNFSVDSFNWDQIYAHHNYFEECPPDSFEVYPLNAWDLDSCHDIDLAKIDPIIPLSDFHLSPNYPNPFNPITNISISITDPGFINLTIHNLQGKLVDQWNTFLEIGNHIFIWDAQKLPTGIYFIKVESKQSNDTQKAILLK
tara:strand:- start:16 stop:1293 length:1278 start_codon:yes stop_codon:yes gene_type:complete